MSSVTPMSGYPVSLLVDAWTKRGGSASMADGILTLTLKDRLTGRTGVTKLEMQPENLAQTFDQCGPKTLVVTRATVDGQETPSLDVGGLVASLVTSAVVELNPPAPRPIDREARPFVPSYPAPVKPPPGQASYAPPPPVSPSSATAPSSDAGGGTPTLGNCHMDSCNWSKVLGRSVQQGTGGESQHVLTLLGGSTAFQDRSAAHIVWNAQPHTVSITCSLTHPSITTGDQTDDLPSNAAAGSPVPDVLMDSFTIYADECHPDAKDMDPDALAKRYGYRAPVEQ